MEFKLFIIAMLSHIIFDFVFQGKRILKNRFPTYNNDNTSRKIKFILIKTFKGNGLHAILHFIGIYINVLIISILNGQAFNFPLRTSILISIFHFTIDEIKSLSYIYKREAKDSVLIFLLDQALHIITLFLITFNFDTTNIMSTLRYKLLNYPSNFSVDERALIIFIVYFATTWGIGVFIKLFIKHISSNLNQLDLNENDKHIIFNNDGEVIINTSLGAKNGGFIIGLLERTLILISIPMNYPAMIGFILTVKSVARLKKLSDDSFAEYFIIGTFLSFIPGVMGGILIRSIL